MQSDNATLFDLPMAVSGQEPCTGSQYPNKVSPQDRAVHNWYRFVLSFPPHLVRDYLEHFELNSDHRVLDPFCGTGTTLVECKRLGIPSVGIEPHPMAYFATKVKLAWNVDPDSLIQHAKYIAAAVKETLRSEGIEDLPTSGGIEADAILRTLPVESEKLLLGNSISPLPLHKTLVLLETINDNKGSSYYEHEILALARILVSHVCNLRFGPEVGLGFIKKDAPVVSPWMDSIRTISKDLRALGNAPSASTQIYNADAREIVNVLAPNSVDAVITSPPYPNEKDYTRTTRLESVILGFLRNKGDLRDLKRKLVRSNTRGVYKGDNDDIWVANHPEIQRIAEAIELRRLELGKTSGFEKLYHRVAKLYFGGMARHLAELRTILKPGAPLAYVVGDQASYLRVMIRTGQIIATIASSLGYEVLGIDLFRTRLATATREQLREEVVLLRCPGKTSGLSPPAICTSGSSQRRGRDESEPLFTNH